MPDVPVTISGSPCDIPAAAFDSLARRPLLFVPVPPHFSSSQTVPQRRHERSSEPVASLAAHCPTNGTNLSDKRATQTLGRALKKNVEVRVEGRIKETKERPEKGREVRFIGQYFQNFGDL